ncbi:unnamed protein product [Cuscuta epithymum]|uniref:Uncharacterized protein n=1 Tax=Cuscuta epithymum TaxID=186058 RepID=A0AAV0EVC5_9ASTE|nr:unnamed protein product [Cuscuta epithymum]
MNFFTKAISAQFLHASSSSIPSTKRVLFQTLVSLQQSSFFTSQSRKPRVTKPKEPSRNLPNPPKSDNESVSTLCPERPSEIPFHSNVANSVDLIGFVDCPVQFEVLPQGRYVAKTVVTFSTLESRDLDGFVASSLVSVPSVAIPVVFQGDLAVMVKCSVKENDCLYVSGQLSGDHMSFMTQRNQMNVHLLVQTMNFVENLKRKKPVGSKKLFPEISELESNNIDDFFDEVEEKKDTPKKGVKSFQRKALRVKEFQEWKNLIRNPNEWIDFRESKAKGILNPRHPDFKHVQTHVSLWIASAPEWVLPGLEGLEFNKDSPVVTLEKTKKGKKEKEIGAGEEECWKSLCKNPWEWWDNRSNKKYKSAADFRHKDSGKQLYVNKAPEWALAILPTLSMKGGKIASAGKVATI